MLTQKYLINYKITILITFEIYGNNNKLKFQRKKVLPTCNDVIGYFLPRIFVALTLGIFEDR